ncbi:aminotransferase class I/II-fold pyridoxal phosphate-dependent enzyme [Streptomyces scopuliridis]|uniref:aminotransferase class I/II-fold pyridoxal phosphate-dependent enzyme n=1 Tax=Streptomyces scopuliridis TaxID=452529 RepID=UPI0035D8663B
MLKNLTELEQRAVDAEINLADGHPRQRLTEQQEAVAGRFTELFDLARRAPFADVEHAAHTAFFEMLGQRSAPVHSGRAFSVYSSSVATMVVSAVLAERGYSVGLLHPTFDNIHDLLVRVTAVTPVSEDRCAAADLSTVLAAGARCLFVTTPNNPTGWFLDAERFRALAAECAVHGVILCVDASFRGFDTRAQFDHYAILEQTGASYLVIEDTGKLWPFAELKLGFLAVSEDLRPAVEHALSDVLLTVSPFVLKLVEALSVDGRQGGLDRLHTLVAANRERVGKAVAQLDGVQLADGDARVSVSRLAFSHSRQAGAVHDALRVLGVHVLPCAQFHWAHPDEGRHLLRLALCRDSESLATGLSKLVEAHVTVQNAEKGW